MKEIIIEEKMLGGVYAQEVRGELVRCKDCKFKIDSTSPFYKMWCARMDFGCDADWYCADGERRDTDA